MTNYAKCSSVESTFSFLSLLIALGQARSRRVARPICQILQLLSTSTTMSPCCMLVLASVGYLAFIGWDGELFAAFGNASLVLDY